MQDKALYWHLAKLVFFLGFFFFPQDNDNNNKKGYTWSGTVAAAQLLEAEI